MKRPVWFFALFAVVFLLITLIAKNLNSSKEVLYNSSHPGSNDCQRIKDIKKRGCLYVGIKIDVPRFSYLDPETNKEEGFEPDIARAIAFKIFGDENAVKFRPITPKTRGPLLDNDELDFVIATFTITEKRKQSYNFTGSYYTDYISFLVNKNSDFKSINDLAGKTIGVSQSTPTKTCLQEKSKELGIDFCFAEYTSYHELKTALATGRIDAISADKSILLGYMDSTTNILEEEVCLQNYGIACKLENNELCEHLNKIMEEIKSDGIWESLIKKWNL